MTKISFKPVDIMRETYEPSHYKDSNQTRPALKLKLRNLKLQTIYESQKSAIIQKPKNLKLTCTIQPYARFIVLISGQGVKGYNYNNTCLCAYLAYLQMIILIIHQKQKKVRGGRNCPMAEMTPKHFIGAHSLDRGWL